MMCFRAFALAIISLGVQLTIIKSQMHIIDPADVQLEEAIITAVERDVEADEQREEEGAAKLLKNELLMVNELMHEFWSLLTSDSDLVATEIENLLQDIDEGRGKFRKRRKMLKYLYPLLVGVLIAKSVVLPLILKSLAALSATSFAMSKIALVTSGLVALKWLLSGSAAGGAHDATQQRTKFEIIHLPAAKSYYGVRPAAGGFGGGGGGVHGTWSDDQNWSDSNVIGSYKYIPLGGDGGAGFGGGDSVSYSDGKPFL